MKKMKKVMAAAIAMMTLSTAAAVTGTVAWFTANNIVSANNMTVQAEAEKGIVIAAYDGTTAPDADDFSDEASAINTTKTLLPTWTSTGTTWYHANSKKSADGQDYTSAGYASVTNGANAGDPQYYMINKFQIKALGEAKDVYVKDVKYVLGANESAQDYDAAIRVLVKSGNTTLFFGKDGTQTGTEQILATTSDSDAVESNESISLVTENTLAAKILNQVNTTAQTVEIYIYYDGEDASCKSDNIVAAFNHATFTVEFTSTAPNA